MVKKKTPKEYNKVYTIRPLRWRMPEPGKFVTEVGETEFLVKYTPTESDPKGTHAKKAYLRIDGIEWEEYPSPLEAMRRAEFKYLAMMREFLVPVKKTDDEILLHIPERGVKKYGARVQDILDEAKRSNGRKARLDTQSKNTSTDH